MLFKIKVTSPFDDRETKIRRGVGEVFETPSRARVVDIAKRRLGKILSVRSEEPRTGRNIMVYMSWILRVGGVETATKQMMQAFPDCHFTLVVKDSPTIPPESIAEFGELADVVIDDGEREYSCDVLVVEHYIGAQEILGRVKAGKVYQVVHADFGTLSEVAGVRTGRFVLDPRVDEVIVPSENARKGLLKRFGVRSTVVPNILLPPKPNATMTFLMATRATAEKGVMEALDLFARFDEAGRDYRVILCSDLTKATPAVQNRIKDNKRIIVVENDAHVTDFLQMANYLVQLSKSESWCYSVHEALAMGVPVLASPVLEGVIEDGKNGYIIRRVLEANVDIIFSEVPKFKPVWERVDPNWQKLLWGEL